MKPTLKTSQKFTSTDTGEYRYFFNGQEADNEVFGEMSNFTAEFWQYDSRLGRRWNLDWIYKPFASNYAAFANNPILFTDPLGLDTIVWYRNWTEQKRVETSDEEHVIILPEIDVKPTPSESSGSVRKNNNPTRKNPYKPGSLPYIVFNNNINNPNLLLNKKNFQWSSTTTSSWMRDFNRSFGTMLFAGMTPAFAPVAEVVIFESVTTFPEAASIVAQGTRQGALWAKRSFERLLTKGYGVYVSATTDEVFLTNIQFAYYVMGIPVVQTGSGFVIGTWAELKTLDVPPDLTTGCFFFDYGLLTGSFFGKVIKEQ